MSTDGRQGPDISVMRTQDYSLHVSIQVHDGTEIWLGPKQVMFLSGVLAEWTAGYARTLMDEHGGVFGEGRESE